MGTTEITSETRQEIAIENNKKKHRQGEKVPIDNRCEEISILHLNTKSIRNKILHSDYLVNNYPALRIVMLGEKKILDGNFLIILRDTV